MIRTPITKLRRRRAVGCYTLATIFVCCSLSLAGCKSGSLTNSEQSCKSTGGLLAGGEVTCTGGVGVVRGEPSLGIIDTDQDLSGDYKLDATISVKKGRAKAYVDTAGGGREGGEVSPGEPLRVEAVVALDEDDEDVSLTSKVLGKEVRGLRYEATVLPKE